MEVKGRAVGTGTVTVTVTRHEILAALHTLADCSVAMVEEDGDQAGKPRHVQRPFEREPDFAATGVIYSMAELIRRAEAATGTEGVEEAGAC